MKYPRGKIVVIILFYTTLCAILFGLGSFAVQAISPGDLIINRLQITGGSGKTDNDFITIYNKSSSTIDLNGFRLVKRTKTATSDTTIKSWSAPLLLNPAAHYTWANSSNGFAASLQADASSTQTISNDNSVALRQGAENSGEIIDAVGWGSTQNGLLEGQVFPQNPGANEILERINYQDTNNNSLDFHIVAPASPSICGNSHIEENETCDDGNIIANDGCDAGCQLENSPANSISPSVTINEFVADPRSGENEWIELYSNSETTIPLSNWTIEDGAGTKTKLAASIGGNTKFYVINKPAGSLNNSGDMIILRNANEEIIDQVAYGDWDDGDTADNAPTAADPNSVARNNDGFDTNSDGMDFSITASPTKNLSNIITPHVSDSDSDTTYDYSRDIIISEISPNPLGIDEEHSDSEFIEIYNRSDRYVRLGGWRLEIGDKEFVYEFPPEFDLAKGQYYILRGTNIFKLNNSGMTVKLFQPLRQTSYQTVTYKEAGEGQSWILLNEQETLINKIWQWTYVPTLASRNIQSFKPLATFSIVGDTEIGRPLIFDSSDTNTGNEKATYSWNFDDGYSSELANPEHTFFQEGSFNVVLTVKNKHGSSTFSKKVTITKTKTPIEHTNEEIHIASSAPSNLKIYRLLANPEGADGGKEWLELINKGTNSILLNGFRIANKNKKGPLIDENIDIFPGEIYLLSKFLPSLGNAKERISLLTPEGMEIDSIEYDKAPEGAIYNAQKRYWENQTSIKTAASPNTKASSTKSKTILEGTVAVLPGVFGSQYFYLKPDNSEVLYQIYNSKKLFPALAMGQYIKASGDVSSLETGPRLKTATIADVSIVSEKEISFPEKALANSLKEGEYPRLAIIEGEITSKKSPNLTVTDASGDATVYLAKGSKLSIATYAISDHVIVSGILQKSGGTIRLMPRFEKDIIITNAPKGPDQTITSEEISSTISQAPRNNKINFLLYSIISAVGLMSLIGYFAWEYKKIKK